MNNQDVDKIICCEYQDLAKLALSYVILTDKEQYIIELRIRRGMTQQEVADYLSEKWDRDPDRLVSIPTIQNWERSMYKKCSNVWDKVHWIHLLLKNIKP